MKKQPPSRYSLLLAAFLLLAGWTLTTPMRYTLAPESTMHIEGTSSIHDWTCTVGKVAGSVDTEADAAGSVSVMRVEVTVPAGEIDCKNGTMDKKTRKALDVTAHPVITYVLNAADGLAEAGQGRFTLKTTGRLTIAGVDRPLAMTITGERLADGRFRFSGQTPLLMSDFGIAPPTAMLGTLKTGDRVVVHFSVIATPRKA